MVPQGTEKFLYNKGHHCSDKEAVYRMGKYCLFNNCTPDRGLIHKLYREFRKLDTKKTNSPTKRWATAQNRVLKRGKTNDWETLQKVFKILSHQGSANKKLLWNFTLQQSESSRLVNEWQIMSVKIWSMENTHPLFVGLKSCTATVENDVMFSHGHWNQIYFRI